MKRTNLIIDEALLKEAKRFLGTDTYSATVNRALSEAIRLMKLQDLTGFFGSGIWQGDLAAMRDDKTKPPSKAKSRRA